MPPRPELDWTDNGPRARAAGDVYFSASGGLAETETVFLGGCGLPDGWRARAQFAIGELGFGSGLNALATWRLWSRTRSPGAVLHFVSVEGFPLEAEEARRALSPFPELAPWTHQLLARWPVRAYGGQRLWFPEDGFALTVLIGEAAKVLEGLVGSFDAWFLDGFAPSRNPDMWRPDLLQRLAELSAPGARLATYSVAGEVRRALAAAGFEIAKQPGFAGKRERLEGRLAAGPPRRSPLLPYAPKPDGPIAIIGAGIAGAAAASALRRRGLQPLIFEADHPGAGASGNPAALLSPRIDRADTGISRLYRAGFLEAAAFYRALGAACFDEIGLVERAADAADLARLADLLAAPPWPDPLLTPHPEGALHRTAGILRPPAILSALLGDMEVRRARVIGLAHTSQGWIVHGAEGVLAEVGAVVLATGAKLGAWPQTSWAPLRWTRGQLNWAALPPLAPRRAVSDGAYAAPFGGNLAFGATFDRLAAPCPVVPDERSTTANLASLRRLAPDLELAPPYHARAAVRAATPDHAPLAGLVPDRNAFLVRHAQLRLGRPPDLSQPAPACAGLYVLGGLGARGFLLAPLLGERLASELLGEPQALDLGALEAAHPGRFLVRALKRRTDER
jgi:tRNA 5-methylaminomethyl-2-thiouridine biosynthesis bifunctional protein